MLRVAYGSKAGNAHRYSCRGAELRGNRKFCLSFGGVRVDRAVARRLLEALEPHAIEAACQAAELLRARNQDVIDALSANLEQATYEAQLAERRYNAVDPDKRLVARELEARWEATLRRVRDIEARLDVERAEQNAGRVIDREALHALSRGLPALWNAPGTTMATKQRLVRVLVEEVIVNCDDETNELVLFVHWKGGRHTEIRVLRNRRSRRPGPTPPSPVHALRVLGGHWPDRELAVTLNRMGCKTDDGLTWTMARVRALREKLSIAPFDPDAPREACTTVDSAAHRLGICVGSVHRLIDEGTLPATQLLPGAPWQIPIVALESEPVRIGVQAIIDRRPCNQSKLQDLKTLSRPGL